jgi:hypothetical protein
MLRELFERGPNKYMSIDDARLFDQRPFRSMLIREYCLYRPGRGFHITGAGEDAMAVFETTDIGRKNPKLPLTAYFDAKAYGLPVEEKRRRRLKVKTAEGG